MKHRVNKELLPMLEAFPEVQFRPEAMPKIREILAQAAREAKALSPGVVEESVSLTDEIIEGPDASPLKLRIYREKSLCETAPALLWIHGGGYIIGSIDDDDDLCVRIAKTASCVVVSVDYRLAPENPYPAPIEDCYAALRWMADHVKELNVDCNRIGVAGLSAGGGLTAALTLLARDRKYPNICFQMPLYPMIDDRNNSPSTNEVKEGFVWNQKTNEMAWKMYLGEIHGTDQVPAYAAAARAEDYSGLPYTYTCIGQLDPFRDETLTYVTKLAQAGVDVEFHLYPGCYHSYEGIAPEAKISVRTVNEYINAVKEAFEK